jgi:hypothetical protein
MAGMDWHEVTAWLKDHAWIAWLIGLYGAVLSTWNAWASWRRDVSRFTFKIKYAPSYKPGDMTITAIYQGGPALKIRKASARVVRVKGLRWFERDVANGVDAVLRPENREVPLSLNSEYRAHYWYIDVIADGGKRKRKYLRRLPKFWLKKVELSLISQDQVGSVAIPGQLEKSLNDLVKAGRKERKKKP